MDSLRQLVPSMGSLVVFEAAGRLMSFSGAARELAMTQAAVSYSIARLEDQLGTSLFLREYRRVRLTEAGRRFHADVSIGLLHIQRSAKSIRSAAVGTHVTLSCSTAFAAFWMVPRMNKFRADLPGIDLRIQTSERDLDLAGEGIPLAIRGGSPDEWPQFASEVLAPEEIYPVCGANYRGKLVRNSKADELLSHQLIHLDEPFRRAATWGDWLSSAGVVVRRPPKGLQINDYVLVIQSVIEGQGVALGWAHLVEGMVAKGVLRRLTRHSLITGKNFYITWPRDIQVTAAVRQVREWLVAQRKN